MPTTEDLVLVHSDCNTPLDGLWCPLCRLHPDMQSTEFHTPPTPPEQRYPLALCMDEDGIWWLKGRTHEVWMQKRPGYCDRGHYIAHVEPAFGAGIEFTIDEADHWPRYFMDFDRMVAEVRDWLEWRESDGPKLA